MLYGLLQELLAGPYTVTFDIYGRFAIELLPTSNGWRAYRKSNGLRVPYRELIIPNGLGESELAQFLDDHFHEYAQPGQVIRRVDTNE